MKKIFRGPFVSSLFPLLLMMLMQLVCAGLFGLVAAVFHPLSQVQLQVWALLLSSFVTVVILLWLYPVRFGGHAQFGSGRSIPLFAAMLAGLSMMVGGNILISTFDVPNWYEEDFSAMLDTFPGILALALVAPVVEELVFRGCMLGSLLRSGVRVWPSILFVSVLFGAVHVNPAQVCYALCFGVILSMLYYRAGSLWPCIFLHVVNNASAVVCGYCFPEEDGFTWERLLGLSTPLLNLSALLFLTVSVLLMRYFWTAYGRVDI